MAKKLGDLTAKQAAGKNNLRVKLDKMATRLGRAERRQTPIRTLEDLTNSMGLQEAGEFRSGNGVEPGSGFTGGRFGYPGFEYNGVTYFLVGVVNDVEQVGMALSDGKLYAGGGAVVLDTDGVSIRWDAGSTSNAIKFYDATGATLHAGMRNALSDRGYLIIYAESVPSQDSKVFVQALAPTGKTARVFLESYVNSITYGTLMVGEKVDINYNGDDIDTQIRGAADNNLVFVDASTDRVGIGTATPAVKLDVVGAISASGTITANAFLGLGAPTTLTIATGAVTATRSYHKIDTEAAAASDDLDTINGGVDGNILILRCVASARDVVVRDNAGNIQLAGGVNFTLGNLRDRLVLQYDAEAAEWLELSRSDNGA